MRERLYSVEIKATGNNKFVICATLQCFDDHTQVHVIDLLAFDTIEESFAYIAAGFANGVEAETE